MPPYLFGKHNSYDDFDIRFTNKNKEKKKHLSFPLCRVCNYDSKYYCYECHENDSALIPARLVYNWDFTLYPVCSVNLQWLSAISHQPLINLRTVNPELYRHIEDLAELQVCSFLRVKSWSVLRIWRCKKYIHNFLF